jgi:hypothetical protein
MATALGKQPWRIDEIPAFLTFYDGFPFLIL